MEIVLENNLATAIETDSTAQYLPKAMLCMCRNRHLQQYSPKYLAFLGYTLEVT